MSERKVAIVLFGRPGSGKGTQAKLLADRFGLYQFTTSKEGREYIKTHSDLETQRQMGLYKAGILFEPPWLLRVVLDRTKELFSSVRGIVFDGSPRTLYEAEGIYPFLVELFGKENIIVFIIEITEEEQKRRAGKRLVCNVDSQHVYIRSDEFFPGSSCPEGDGVLEVRDLDNPEVVSTRTSEYISRTVPGTEFIKEKHGVISINGEQSIGKVYDDIVNALREKGVVE